MTATEPKVQQEYLRYDFSDAEITAFAKTLGRENQQLSELEKRKASISKDLGGQIAIKQAEIDRLASLVTNGHEYRNIACHWILDLPERGRKTLIRTDTGEEIRTSPMSDEDKQASFDFNKKREEEEETLRKYEEERAREANKITDEAYMLPAAPDNVIEMGFVVERIDTGSGSFFYVTGGHVSKEEFARTTEKSFSLDFLIAPISVKYMYRRMLTSGDWAWCKKKDDGAQPVTVFGL